MRSLIAVLLLLLPLAARAAPADLPPQDLAAIRNVILAQQAAFTKDDAEAAYAYAAPRLHEIYRTAASFIAMVKRDYPAVYRPKVFAFRPFAWIEGRPVQPVLVVGPSDVPMTALYLMEHEAGGGWLIAGVVLVPEPEKAT